MLIKELEDKKLIKPPSWLDSNTMYLAITGSLSYGVSSDSSDYDVSGFCIPPKSDIFPYQDKLYMFDKVSVFEQYQQHHILDKSALGGKGRNYDLTIYNIVKYFHLVADGNPNMVDSLFVGENYVLHSTQISNLIRENRRLFLSKKLWPKFKGYAISQLHKGEIKKPEVGSKRYEDIKKHGFDTKFMYHVVRLLSEIEYILMNNDLVLIEPGRQAHMKAIRNGEITVKEIEDWANDKMKSLESLYISSKVKDKPDMEAIRTLLLNCIESHYGSLDKFIEQSNWSLEVIREIDKIISPIRFKI